MLSYHYTQLTVFFKLFTNNGARSLDTPTRLLAGALAGITSVCTTYPLDLVRSRLSIASASIALPSSASAGSSAASAAAKSLANLGIKGMTLKVMREEGGMRGLYRGLVATAMGVAPYVGINFAAYETLRGIITPPEKTNSIRKLSCGALAGENAFDELHLFY